MKPILACKNGDGAKVYAKGLCRSCYVRNTRQKKIAAAAGTFRKDESEDEDIVGFNPNTGKQLTQTDFDFMISEMALNGRSVIPATAEQADDTDAIKAARVHLQSKTSVYRRRLVRQMVYEGYTEEDVINEFLSRPELKEQFIKPLSNVVRVLREDIAAVQKGDDRLSGGIKLNQQDRYIAGLERWLRFANSFAQDKNLTSRERSTWAKTGSEMQRNLAILEHAIHVVPGRGDLPVGGPNADADNPDSEYEDADDYELPNVRGT